jgi:hypothetical protein
MKAELTSDWSEYKVGSVLIKTNEGADLAVVGFLAVNPELVSMRSYKKEMRQLAERLVSCINEEKK